MARIDLKFDEKFLEALWSGEKTQTMRRGVKGAIGDTFLVEYPEKSVKMEFEITGVTEYSYLSGAMCCDMYKAEGFYSSEDMEKYLKEIGYSGPVYVHTFRLTRQFGLMKPDYSTGVRTTPKSDSSLQPSKSIYTEGQEALLRPVTYSFEVALNRLKTGKRQQRKGWNGKGMYIEMQVPDENSKMTLPYIYMKTAQDDLVPWLASQSDLLSEDWCNYEGK